MKTPKGYIYISRHMGKKKAESVAASYRTKGYSARVLYTYDEPYAWDVWIKRKGK